jgi:hypothetical protein
MRWKKRGLALAGLLIGSIDMLRAQDAFEIHVLEYEELQPGEFTIEAHSNYVGNRAAAAAAGNFHHTWEVTAGVTDHLSFGVMQLNGKRPGSPLESAGWRLVPHVYVPRAWHWPLDVGLVTEFSFENKRWAANSRSIDLIPVLQKRLRRAQLDLNPSFARALHGPGTREGWGFGLAARVGIEATRRFTPSIEYYSDWGPLPAFAPLRAQGHQIIPGGDVRLTNNIVWSVGLGVGITASTDRIVYKSRVEITFGRKRH